MFKQQLYATPLNHAGADFFFLKKRQMISNGIIRVDFVKNKILSQEHRNIRIRIRFLQEYNLHTRLLSPSWERQNHLAEPNSFKLYQNGKNLLRTLCTRFNVGKKNCIR
jgi:hypothetical protein